MTVGRGAAMPMATRVGTGAHPAAAPVRRRLPGIAQVAALAVGAVSCGLGAALALGSPPHPAVQIARAHRGGPGSRSVRGLRPSAQDAMWGVVEGTVEEVGRSDGSIRLRVGSATYVYYRNTITAYPGGCFGPQALRPGIAVRLQVPWYLGGQSYAHRIAPLHGCGTLGAG